MLILKSNPHGGDVYRNPRILDFSANANPFGMPGPVREAIASSAERCHLYPDVYCGKLRHLTAQREGVGEGEVLFGNGASELIYAFAYSLPKDKPALLVAPSFCEYENALKAAGIVVEYHCTLEEDGFHLTDTFFKKDLSRYGGIFLCSPSNPVGVVTKERVIRRILETGVRLLLDLTFQDFTANPGLYPVPNLLQAFPNLTVLRAFTKNYAMAGVRLGYALCADAGFLEVMSEKTPCWNVSVIAQEAGVAALGCGAWLRETVDRILTEKTRLSGEVQKLGIRVFPGEANYLLLWSEEDLPRKLLRRGILVRDCADYVGLGPGYLRVAVRKEEENAALLSALRAVLTDCGREEERSVAGA